MKKEELEKGNDLFEKISFCQKQIKHIEYMLNENVIERESFLKFNGLNHEEIVNIPVELFRTIGKLLKSEYTIKLNGLQKEFKEL